VEAALEARSSLLSADATLESLWSLPDPQYALRLLRAEPLQDSKGKELKGDAVTGALEAHAEAAAALLGLVPLLQLRASLTSLDGPPIVFRVGLAGGGSSVGAGRSAIKTGFENLLHVGGGGNAEADEAGKAAGKIEVSSVVVVTPPKHAAPQLAPHSLADATRTERLALGAALWEIEEVTAPMLPCKCPLRKLPDPTAKQVAADRPTSASGGRGKRDKQELLEGGAAPKGADEDAAARGGSARSAPGGAPATRLFHMPDKPGKPNKADKDINISKSRSYQKQTISHGLTAYNRKRA
jgi:hypothetical protein